MKSPRRTKKNAIEENDGVRIKTDDETSDLETKILKKKPKKVLKSHLMDRKLLLIIFNILGNIFQ